MFVSKFYKKDIEERIKIIAEHANLSNEEIEELRRVLSLEKAKYMVENVAGRYCLPLGFANHFVVNGVERYIPMAIEEPSVIAAASKGAKMSEGFVAKASETDMIGQIQLIDREGLIDEIRSMKKEIEEIAIESTKNMERYGGGFKEFWVRRVKGNRKSYLLVEFSINVGDSMGANSINTAMEKIGLYLSKLADVRLRILTNLTTRRMVKARSRWKIETIDEFLDAYELAVIDPYRRATHNKGIMNGIDAVVIATGNDWRAVEAGAHTYSGITNKPLTKYWEEDGYLIGEIEMPLAVSTVGVVLTNPLAKINQKIMKVKNAKELAEIIASVGLSQNFAALYALSTEGIQRGHMKLHARNLAIRLGARQEILDQVVERIIKEFNFNEERVKEIIKELESSSKE